MYVRLSLDLSPGNECLTYFSATSYSCCEHCIRTAEKVEAIPTSFMVSSRDTEASSVDTSDLIARHH